MANCNHTTSLNRKGQNLCPLDIYHPPLKAGECYPSSTTSKSDDLFSSILSSLADKIQANTDGYYYSPSEVVLFLQKKISEADEYFRNNPDAISNSSFSYNPPPALDLILNSIDCYTPDKEYYKPFDYTCFGSGFFLLKKSRSSLRNKSKHFPEKSHWYHRDPFRSCTSLPRQKISILLVEDTIYTTPFAKDHYSRPEALTASTQSEFIEQCASYVLSSFEEEKANHFTPSVLVERKAVLTSVYNVIHKEIYTSYTPFQRKKLVSLLKKYIARKFRKLLSFFRLLNKKTTTKRKRDLRKIYTTILRVHFKSSLNESTDHSAMNQTNTGKLISLLSHSINSNEHSGYDQPSQVYEIQQPQFKRTG